MTNTNIQEQPENEWVEASTPPEKEGFYNVITECNGLLISFYEMGDWEYNRVGTEIQSMAGMGIADRVVRYRPSTYQPFNEKNEREFPCDQCEEGEFIQVGGGGPDGIFIYQCNECGHKVSFP